MRAATPEEDEQAAALALAEKLKDRTWRLENLYTVEPKEGVVVPFRMNRHQRRLLAAIHKRNIIPKARQLGFTTFILLLMLDACLFNSGTRCAVIAHDVSVAGELFTQKVRAVYDRLPDWLKALRPLQRDQGAKVLAFANGSLISVMTSARSGTWHWLLVSEHGKICARYPAKAKEIRTGAIPAVPKSGVLFIESTGEGADGDFYEECQAAKRREDQGAQLTALDMKMHFFPWWEEPEYRLPAGAVIVPDDVAKYFDELADKYSIQLDAEQRAWYAKTKETLREEMFREYPSVYDEVFKTAIEGAFFTLEMAAARKAGRIGSVPYEAANGRVHRFWDIGVDDYTAIWFVQVTGRDVLLIDYEEWSGVGLPTIHKDLDKRREERLYLWGVDVMPHDIAVLEWGNGLTRIEQARALKFDVIVAPSPAGIVGERIAMIRNVFPRLRIDAQRCAVGIRRLDSYRREWDERLGVWKSAPRHDEASHGCSALGGGVQMIEMLPVATNGGGPGGVGGPGAYVPRRRAA